MTELFKARGKLVEQEKILRDILLMALEGGDNHLLSKVQGADAARYETFTHVYNAALALNEKWALKLQADLNPVPVPVPPSGDDTYFGYKLPAIDPTLSIGATVGAGRKQVDNAPWGQRVISPDELVQFERIFGHQWIGMGYNKNAKPLDGLTVREVLFELGKMWHVRNYRERLENEFFRCTFRYTEREHAHYWNTAGMGLDFTGDAAEEISTRHHACLFEDLGGQAIQSALEERGDDTPFVSDLMLRINETPDFDEDATDGGWLLTDLCKIQRTAQDTSRPAFAVSHFRSRNPVAIRQTTIDNTRWTDGTIRAKSYGSVMCQGVQEYTDARGVKHPAYDRRFVWDGGSIRVSELQQPMFLLQWGLSDVLIQNASLIGSGGQNEIRIEHDPRPGVQTNVTVQGCEGNTKIRYNGKIVGDVEGGFQS